MNTLEAYLPSWVLRHRLLVIIFPILMVAAGASGIPKLAFDTSYRVFFSEDNPELMAFERIEETYVKDDNIQIILAPKDGNVFTREALSAVETLTTQAWHTPFSNRVDSITNFQFTEAEEDDLVVRDMVKDAATLDQATLAKIT